MIDLDIVERPTAGKRIRVETVRSLEKPPTRELAHLIQSLADEGFNYCGLLQSYDPPMVGGLMWPGHWDYLFIKASE